MVYIDNMFSIRPISGSFSCRVKHDDNGSFRFRKKKVTTVETVTIPTTTAPQVSKQTTCYTTTTHSREPNKIYVDWHADTDMISTPEPEVIEKIVEVIKPVERVVEVEKIVEKPVEKVIVKNKKITPLQALKQYWKTRAGD